MDSWWPYVWMGEATWVVSLCFYILFERRSPRSTLAWILVLSFLPVAGLAVWFVFGPRKFDRKKLRHAAAQAAVTAAVPEEPEAGGAHHELDQAAHLMQLCERAAGRPARPRTADFALFIDGRSMYAALLEAIAGATHHVHLEYYIWEPDGIGTRLRDALRERAEAGVEVRVLVDGFGSSSASNRFWRPLRDAGAQVERFNELRLGRWRPRLANFRNHRKIAVIDGRRGFVGGMNVKDVHSSEFSGDAAWRDSHLAIGGAAVRGLQMVFCEGWHYATGSAPRGEHYFPWFESGDEGHHLMQIVASGPDENLDAIHKLFFSAIAGAHTRVQLTSPYFVPDESIMTALETAALRGADVRVLVPDGGDMPLVAAAGRSYYSDLIRCGVRIFEYGPPVLHAKTLVVDDVVAIVGTANTDTRSFRLNFEVLAVSYERDAAELLATVFAEDLERAKEVTRETLEADGIGQRLVQNVARLLSPIL